MADQAQTLRELAQVRADNRELLNAVVGGQGTALGRKNFDLDDNPEGDPCIIVYVPHKIHENFLSEDLTIPSKLATSNGELEAPTDVVVTDVPDEPKDDPVLDEVNQSLVDTLQWKNGELDFIGPGAQVGAAEAEGGELGGYVGTVGYIVREKREGGKFGFLTNQHVGLHAGHSIYVPGFLQNAVRVGVTREVMEHRPDDEWLPGVDEKFAFVRTDSAFVAAEDAVGSLMRNDVLGVGADGAAVAVGEPFQVDLDSMEVIGMPVKKVGRTTGLQRGTIVAFGYGIWTDEEFIDRAIDMEPANFYTDFLIAPRGESEAFSAPGDSGSAILLDTDDDDNRPLALLWGGWPTDIGRSRGLEDLTYGIDLNRILMAMDLELA